MGKQQSCECTFTISTMREGYASIQGSVQSTNARFNPCLIRQSIQFTKITLKMQKVQT